MNEETRRELLKRLAAIAATGYLAPEVIRIDSALATHKPGHNGGPGCSMPPCRSRLPPVAAATLPPMRRVWLTSHCFNYIS